MKLNWKFQGRGGFKQKTFHGGGVDNLEPHNVKFVFFILISDIHIILSAFQ